MDQKSVYSTLEIPKARTPTIPRKASANIPVYNNSISARKDLVYNQSVATRKDLLASDSLDEDALFELKSIYKKRN